MNIWWFAVIIILLILMAAVFLNHHAWNIFIILFTALGISAFVAGVSVHIIKVIIYRYIDRAIHSGRVLTRGLASVSDTQHQLSHTELYKIAAQLRHDLADIWMFKTPMNEAKIKQGLTSITDNSSQITQFEFERIRWLFKRGQRKLRRTRLILITFLTFSGFIVGCVMGVYLQNWYHFLK